MTIPNIQKLYLYIVKCKDRFLFYFNSDNEIVAGIMEFAGIRGYMALTEACMRLERSHYEVEISQDLKDKYIGMANSGVNMLTD
jgi:hypothetical protein